MPILYAHEVKDACDAINDHFILLFYELQIPQ